MEQLLQPLFENLIFFQYQIWQIVFQGEDPSLTNQEFTDLIAQLPAGQFIEQSSNKRYSETKAIVTQQFVEA